MAKENMEQYTKSKNTPNKKTVFGHNVTIQGLNDWHQVCLQWCQYKQQQQANETCSMYCFKKSNRKKNTPPLESLSASSSDVDINEGRSLKNVLSNFVESLDGYSIVIVKGTEASTDEYMKATEKEYYIQEPMTRDRNVREINLKGRIDTVRYNTELMVNKTYEFSKSLLRTWKANNRNKWINEFDYTDTLYTMKSRAVKIMDVARGKYDDDSRINPPNKSTGDKPSDIKGDNTHGKEGTDKNVDGLKKDN